MHWLPVALSYVASLTSAISFMAAPMYTYQFAMLPAANEILVVAFALPVIVLIFLPLYAKIGSVSIYEFLEVRFSLTVRMMGSTLFLLNRFVWMGMVIYVPSMVLSYLTGIELWQLVLIIGTLTTVYTCIGGMRAVIWTDVAQFAIFTGAYVGILLVILAAFDWQPMAVYELASATVSGETGKPHTQLFSYEFQLSIEATIWAILFQRLVAAVQFGSRQEIVQRLHAAGDGRGMFKAMMGGAGCGLMFTLITLPVAWGFVAFYQKFPELAAPISHTDQVLPTFVVQQLPAVIRGVIMAGVLAALMSTFDSAINAMSNVMINDFFRRNGKTPLPEEKLVRVAKTLTLSCGLMVLLFSLWQYEHRGDTALERLGKMINLIAPPVPMFFLLGIFTRRANAPGVMCGALAGILFVLPLNGLGGLFEPLYSGINWMWIAGLGLIVSCAVGYLASLLFAPPGAEKLRGLTLLGE